MKNEFLKRIQDRLSPQPNGCILWTGTTRSGGYGRIQINGRAHYLHRALYEEQNGPVPGGYVVDHICNNRSCCNLEHLRAIPGRDNTLRGNGCFAVCARATHCLRGHEYSGDNLLVRDGKYRGCRACTMIRNHEAYLRKKARNKTGEKGVMKTAKPRPERTSSGKANTFENLMMRVEISDSGCWLWLGATNKKGYGQGALGGERGGVHRLVYRHLKGPIPKGLVLDHLCRQKSCCNPDHLEPVTHRENILRGNGLAAQQVKRTYCPHGHPYKGYNLIIYKDGRRACRACNNRRGSIWQKEKRLPRLKSERAAKRPSP